METMCPNGEDPVVAVITQREYGLLSGPAFWAEVGKAVALAVIVYMGTACPVYESVRDAQVNS